MSKLHNKLGISDLPESRGVLSEYREKLILVLILSVSTLPFLGLSAPFSMSLLALFILWIKSKPSPLLFKVKVFSVWCATVLLLSLLLSIGIDGGGKVGYAIGNAFVALTPTGASFGKTYLFASLLSVFLIVRMHRSIHLFYSDVYSLIGEVKPSKRVVKKAAPSYKVESGDILLGYNEEHAVYWKYMNKKLTNRHMVIYGKSGNGKSYLVQRLVMALTKDYPVALVDIKPSFTNEVLEDKFVNSVSVHQNYLAREPVPLNPFNKATKKIDKGVYKEDSSYDIASKVSSVFSSVYSTMGDQQVATLIKAITDGIDGNTAFNFNDLLDQLRKIEIDENEKASPKYKNGDVLANKIEPLVNANIFSEGNGNWGDIFNKENKRASVLQFANVNDVVKKVASEFLLWGMYDYALATGSKGSPLPIIVDESHNVKYNESSPSYKILKEGRSFGVSLIIATQSPSSDKDELKVIDQAAHKIIFKPTDDDQDYFAKVLHKTDNSVSIQDWKGRLANLSQGECYSLGLDGVDFVKIPAM